jgi:hypothetical protein
MQTLKTTIHTGLAASMDLPDLTAAVAFAIMFKLFRFVGCCMSSGESESLTYVHWLAG